MPTITIACQGADVKSIDELIEFQGNLKSLSKEDFEKLRNSILKYGISFAIQVWIDPDKKCNIIDGHQTLRVLLHLRDKEGYEIPLVPLDYIEAKDKKEAKEKILLRIAQYGKTTCDSMYEFMIENSITIQELKTDYRIPDINFGTLEIGYFKEKDFEEPKKGQREIECPFCKGKFKI